MEDSMVKNETSFQRKHHIRCQPRKSIPVFISSDERYVMYLHTTITSILTNTRVLINLFILDGGIKKKSKRELTQNLQAKFQNFTLDFIKIELDQFKNLNAGYFSLNAFSRFFIPIVKPNIEKAIYLDSDIIVEGDINDLFMVNLFGAYLAAVPHLHELHYNNKKTGHDWITEIKRRLNIPKSHKYFNAGVLIINCRKWREKRITEKLINIAVAVNSKLECADQDVLNYLFQLNYKILPVVYNLIVSNCIDLGLSEKDFGRKSVKVIHFTHGSRPWQNQFCLFGDVFWKYAKNSPFYENLRLNLLFSEIMNFQSTVK